ncbi:MAG: single-stranded DNA-binding protein [Clostridiales bacterium]|nr:single-stranded DNA-binding protein [Clostridiales bacterium]
MMNKVVLIGRLTRDPELRYTSSGIALARFTLAVDRSFTNQQGEREADFIPITVWRGQAENCAKYLNKGRLVAVSGRIQTGSYETPEGQRRYTTEVVADDVRFLEWGDRAESRGQDAGMASGDRYNSPDTGDVPGFNPLEDGGEDELPF